MTEEPGAPKVPPGPSPEDARDATRIALAGVGLFPLLTWGFVARLDFSLLDALYVSALFGVLPFLSVAQLPLVGSVPIDRMTAYLNSATVLATSA